MLLSGAKTYSMKTRKGARSAHTWQGGDRYRTETRDQKRSLAVTAMPYMYLKKKNRTQRMCRATAFSSYTKKNFIFMVQGAE